MSSLDEDILDLLAAAGTRKRRKLVRKQPKPPKPSHDDDIIIPAIFQTSAVNHEKVYLEGQKIQQQLAEDAQKSEKEFKDIIGLKRAVVEELNDNGSELKYSNDNENQAQYIESLVKRCLHKGYGSLTRHFYLYGEPKAKPSKVTPVISFRLAHRDYEGLFNYINMKEFVSCAIAEENPVTLRQLAEFFEYVGENHKIEPDDSFVGHMEAIGANVNILNSKEVPVKLNQFCSGSYLVPLRLQIIFHYVMASCEARNVLYFQVLRGFVLTVNDFNLNESPHLNRFVRLVFPALVRWRYGWMREQAEDDAVHDIMVIEFNTLLNEQRCYIYGKKETKRTKDDTELKFNTLRHIHRSQTHSADPQTTAEVFLAKLCSSLYRSFISGTDYLAGDCSSQIPIKVVHSIASRVNKLDHELDTLYQNYYKLVMANICLTHCFEQNEDTEANRQQYEHIKTSNYTTLKKALNVVAKARDKFHVHLGHVVRLSNVNSEKDDLVDVVTNTYRVLNYMHSYLSKDVKLVHEDVFYDMKLKEETERKKI